MSFLSLEFMRTALLASLLVGTALSMIGVLILVRGISFSGLAAAQLAALGSAIAAAVGWHVGGFGVALALVLAGLGLLPFLSRERRIPGEAWVAALYILGACLSVLLLSKSEGGETHSMEIFFGNLLSVGQAELVEAGAVLAATLAVLGLWLHRWIWLAFDPLGAQVAGVRAGAWNLALSALLALGMTVSIHVLGVLLAFAYLILPAAAGLLVARSVRTPFVVAPAVAAACTIAGCWASLQFDLPTGPLIAALLAGALLGAAVVGVAGRSLLPNGR